MTSPARLRRALAGVALALILCVAGPVAGASAAAPSNDNFADAVAIPFPPADPGSASATGTTDQASAETGEPNPAGAAFASACSGTSCASSVWYRLTPDRDGRVALRTCELGGAQDTVIGVYTGTSVDGLTTVVANDDDNGSTCGVFSSRVDFDAQQGTTYYIEVAGYRAGSTSFTLHVSAPPIPDPPAVFRGWSGSTVNPDRTPLTFTINANDGATLACSVDGAAAQACTSPFTTSGAGMADGTTHSLAVTATIGSQTSSASEVTWTIDKTAPVTTISSGPADGDSVGPSATWAVQGSEDGGLNCTVDGAAVNFTGCAGLTANTDRNVTAGGLCDSLHTIGFEAADEAGNPDPAPPSRTVTYSGNGDCAAPTFDNFYVDTLATLALPSIDVDGHGAGTTGHYEWGLTTAYGHTMPDMPLGVGASLGADGNDVGQFMVFLDPETTYHVRFVAHNPTGTSTSDDHEFTTPATSGDAPEPSLTDASGITDTTAMLNGHLHTNQPSVARFEYGTTADYGHVTDVQVALDDDQDFAAPLTGLEPGTTYHYRLAAGSDGGTARTPDATFTTTSTGQPGPTSPAAPAQNGSPAALLDGIAPGIHAAGANRAHFGRKFVWAWVSSSENATGIATGTIQVPGAAAVVRLSKATVKLHAGKRTKIKMRIRGVDAKRLKRYLAGHKPLVKITLAARDSAGNRTTKRLSFRLAR